MDRDIILTKQGLDNLEEQLEYLKSVRREEIAEQIKVARAFGDISENAEYDEAKNEQARIEGEIMTIENMLRHAIVVNDDAIGTDSVTVGSKVKVLDIEYNEEMEYSLVGSAEASPMEMKISNESPVGTAIIGHKVGEVVEVEAPGGVIKLQILEIRK